MSDNLPQYSSLSNFAVTETGDGREWYGHFPHPEGHRIRCNYSLGSRVRFSVLKM
jgi:hypothetical protein